VSTTSAGKDGWTALAPELRARRGEGAERAIWAVEPEHGLARSLGSTGGALRNWPCQRTTDRSVPERCAERAGRAESGRFRAIRLVQRRGTPTRPKESSAACEVRWAFAITRFMQGDI